MSTPAPSSVSFQSLAWLLSEDGIPMSDEEAGEFYDWINHQPRNPYVTHRSVVTAFRLDRLASRHRADRLSRRSAPKPLRVLGRR